MRVKSKLNTQVLRIAFCLLLSMVLEAHSYPLLFEALTYEGKLKSGESVRLILRMVKPRKISRKTYYGVDGGTPKLVVEKFELEVGGQKYSIPARFYDDLGNVDLSSISARVDGREIYISVSGGDGAGTFSVTFFFQPTKLVGRSVETHFSKKPIWEKAS